jgi:hypothetical protein
MVSLFYLIVLIYCSTLPMESEPKYVPSITIDQYKNDDRDWCWQFDYCQSNFI